MLADDAMRRGEEDELHPLLLGGVHLFGDRRHVLALATIDHGGREALADHRACAVDRRVAATDDDGGIAEIRLPAMRLSLEEMQRAEHAGQTLPGRRTCVSFQVPRERNTASNRSSRSAREMSAPMRELNTNCTPRRRMISTSRSKTLRGSR